MLANTAITPQKGTCDLRMSLVLASSRPPAKAKRAPRDVVAISDATMARAGSPA